MYPLALANHDVGQPGLQRAGARQRDGSQLHSGDDFCLIGNEQYHLGSNPLQDLRLGGSQLQVDVEFRPAAGCEAKVAELHRAAFLQ